MTTDIVEIRGQQATTTSLAIAEGCKLDHASVIKIVRKYRPHFEAFGFLGFEIQENRGTQGAQTEYAVLTEDQATFAITLFRNNETVIRFKVALVKAFRKALNEIARLYANPPRADIIKAKRAAHNPMMDALIEVREEEGKETNEVHFMCENKLCNWAVTGRFAKANERELSNEDATLLERVRSRNAALIVAGLEYQERKARLSAFATRTRTKLALKEAA